jgi:ComF family protein
MLETAVDRWTKALSAWLWPPRCVLCGQAGQPGLDLCAGCEADLPINDAACSQCAEPLAGAIGRSLLCGACLRRMPPFQCCAAFRYAYPVDRLIQGLKYRRRLAYGRVLGQLLARRLMTRDGALPQLIVPVPLGTRRYRERGYNQARELALPIHHALGLPLRSDLIVRRRETLEQAALDRKQRRKNIRDAFALTGALPSRHIAIVDDVVTTGSTVTELAKLLRRAGAERVEVWAVARAPRK